MPRITTDDLFGYAMDLVSAEVQMQDNGMPLFNGNGEPRMHTIWRFVFKSMPDQQGNQHVVLTTPMDKAAKDRIVEALTGGVQVVSKIDLPPGIQL